MSGFTRSQQPNNRGSRLKSLPPATGRKSGHGSAKKPVAKKKTAGRLDQRSSNNNKRALPTLSVVPNTIGVKSLTTVFGMGTGVTSSP